MTDETLKFSVKFGKNAYELSFPSTTMVSEGQAAADALKSAKANQIAARKSVPQATTRPSLPVMSAQEARVASWSKTGIIGFRDSGLQEIPCEVWGVGSAGRVLDLGSNHIMSIAASISQLPNLQKLRLDGNSLQDEGMPWEAMTALVNLTHLSVNSNRLNSLPEQIGRLASLKVLSVVSNALSVVHGELGKLKKLQHIALAGNRLETLPSGLAGCEELVELDLRNNKVSVIPESFRSLLKLQVLSMDSNLVAAVPPVVLRECRSLHTITLHKNPLTVEQFRETAGFSEYEGRRIKKCSKQIDMRVMLNRDGFDEGIDNMEWQHW
ncbi:hypothetical protein CYMTET_17605 [Cymbomonas tetramitiformis]|uniref:Uncharacterized protein n=1 Tax=Cymbomonas tetramitiformis TaxID=36881 RepID=A0AAE0L6T4_9CHLO|nr:hypothetical protein CYMTET_17605 [Cymbomonas tetramitiformis]